MNKEQLLIKLVDRIKNSKLENFTIMEVCGTHTKSISKLGIRELFYPKIKLLSGPGCPVCVTPEGYIDAAINILNRKDVILTTFGDLMKVKGSIESLIEQREKRKNINIVYSPLDAIKIAQKNRNFQVVFLAVGFETTAPTIGVAIKIARENNIKNFSVLSGLKVMRPVLHKILKNEKNKVQGIICPGHVAVITGSEYFRFITEEYNVPAVVAGFEGLDIISAIYFLIAQKDNEKKQFKNLYKTCVTPYGNVLASRIMDEVFSTGNSIWRGIGQVHGSGLYLNHKYEEFDALKKFNLVIQEKSNESCVCSQIILGQKIPYECPFFAKRCTPESPVGPCMVSSEGSCCVYYKYGGKYYGRNY
ncbi:hydrogenase expression/formation protein HypD [Clostridium algifaecis]|uniref:Hydrogenase expression/formation protein HypD n=1 Tax=Clostridium algifaecis TaxID=1472040 RepID=A0ABS4KQP0_9CLOT|nr:hydrogenase formation protein HypD [Clostridium algifaecis]MBP2031701.1 hydrogenase expression/formation protein HypD [Clostridium algifaecis]